MEVPKQEMLLQSRMWTLQQPNMNVSPYNNESMQGNTTATLPLYEQNNTLKQQVELQKQEILLQSMIRTQQQVSFNQAQLSAASLRPMPLLTQQSTLSMWQSPVQNTKTVTKKKGTPGRTKGKHDSYQRKRRKKREM